MSTKTQVVTIGTKPMSAIMAEWKAEAAKMVAKTRKPTEPGWLTSREIMEAVGFGRDRGERFIRERVKAGRCDVFQGSAINAAGKVYRQVWYRLKP